MPAPSRRRLVAAIAAAALTAGAHACKPVSYVPRGFDVEGPHEVSANGAATLHLPANARGAVYSNYLDHGPRRPSAAAFRLVDRTTGRRQRVRIAEPGHASAYGGAYLVEPTGGFVAGHTYALTTGRRYEPNSPFHPALRLVIDAAIAWPPAPQALRLRPDPSVVDGVPLTVMTLLVDPGLEAYRGQITATMAATPRVTADEAMWSDCDWGDVSVLRRTAACHAITATSSWLAMSDEAAITQGVNRAECAGR